MPSPRTATSARRESRSAVSPTVEALNARLARLVAKRQELRSRAAGNAALERNRRDIVRAQHQLSHALIARYGGHAQKAA